MAFSINDQDGNRSTFTQQDTGITSSPNVGKITVYLYTSKEPMKFATTFNCEEICTEICRKLNIKPFVQLIYGICERDDLSSKFKTKLKSNQNANLYKFGSWPLPGECLDSTLSYCFRIRFRIPEMEGQLQHLDPESFNYLYYQMRHDLVYEQISEICYPEHKNIILSVVVVDMVIDLQIVLERDKAANELEINSDSRAKAIIKAYKSYLPRSIWKNHCEFTYKPIRENFQKINEQQFTMDQHKHYCISSLCLLAKNYMMMDQYMVTVDALPKEVDSGDTPLGTSSSSSIPNTNESIKVLVRLWTHASNDPGLKIARISAKPRWILVAITENIERAMVTDKKLSLEISGMDDFTMTFETTQEMKSFISYLNTYKRLTGLWLKDLCPQYSTPSLKDLNETSFHGPIGGIWSLRKLNDYHCGSYIIRQCEQEYFTYYIDINVKRENTLDTHRRFETKIFKIQRAEPPSLLWILHKDGQTSSHLTLKLLADSIDTDDNHTECVPPLLNDKYPELLLCLPKTLSTKKTNIQLSEFELCSRRPQVLDGPKDLQYHIEEEVLSNDNLMATCPGDWIQKGSIKDVPVTLKILHNEGDIATFMNMTGQWGLIQSPQFLKLYALTQLLPFTMVMEYSKYGPFDKFLKLYPEIGISSLKLVLRDLTRGINYLKENHIKHNYIRCSNLFITGFKSPYIRVKIGDPGYPRPYNETDFAWIPMKFYNNPEEAKSDDRTQYWAFATTTYEIFSRCQEDLTKLSKQTFLQNHTNEGFILPIFEEKDFPPEISEIIMDGWAGEKDFDHDAIITSNNWENNDFPEYTVERSCVTASIAVNGGSVEFGMDKKDELGKGQFGVVFIGRFKNENGFNEPVAIKKLNEKNTSADFRNEVQIMHSLRHENVVQLKHWSAKFIIMEFLDYPLDEYLLARQDSPREKLEYFALDIAKGMEYLAKNQIVHRDLAARNVLFDKKKNIVKISDFGLSKKLNNEGIYIGVTNRPFLPVAWFSPEAYEYKKFSMYSDIWSYGVTLYEIFTRGSKPPLNTTASNPKDMAAYLGQKDR
ncbi:uncharacterized protein Dwil_GK25800 [Drosophila willistoni]|uniref:Non-specific protein-tyrosine kinase n=1 Tax=Drosophila willistoni TaxID=7260 RepID=B4NC66_DROWI|nr:uncharacterized protein Dwil_GK25800 [Drosophila willistoni]